MLRLADIVDTEGLTPAQKIEHLGTRRRINRRLTKFYFVLTVLCSGFVATLIVLAIKSGTTLFGGLAIAVSILVMLRLIVKTRDYFEALMSVVSALTFETYHEERSISDALHVLDLNDQQAVEAFRQRQKSFDDAKLNARL